jgi:hypothetical protein
MARVLLVFSSRSGANAQLTGLVESALGAVGAEVRVVDDLNAVGAAWGCVLVSPGPANATNDKLDGNPRPTPPAAAEVPG